MKSVSSHPPPHPFSKKAEYFAVTDPKVRAELIELYKKAWQEEEELIQRERASISAVSLVDMFNNCTSSIIIALATGGAVVAAQYIGAKSLLRARKSEILSARKRCSVCRKSFHRGKC